jgi:3-hydroxyacyl-CoA dehydrogenase/enoyl-CoA hydratase/3-hydroxybutyryl-CoA epimerase
MLQRLRADVQQRGFGLDPAPLSALDLLGRIGGGQRPDAEAAAFAELAVGEVSRARVEVERRAAILSRLTLDDAEPGPLHRLGILGAGVMGAELAVAAANARISVRIREKEPDAL